MKYGLPSFDPEDGNDLFLRKLSPNNVALQSR
jgi:hypothetical protein